MQKGVAEFRKLFQAESDEIFRDATARTVTGVQKRSKAVLANAPVDEGEFVADFDAAIGHWPSDSEQAPDPKKTATRARLLDVIKRAKYGQAIFVENNDPVAGKLEFGYSKQAPQGVIRLAVRQWRRQVRGAGMAAQNRVKKRMVDE